MWMKEYIGKLEQGMVCPQPIRILVVGTLILVAGLYSALSLAATGETQVGVTAASNIDAVGTPPVSPAIDLETGVEL